LRRARDLYWNRQSNPNIPNAFKHDRARLPLDLATQWRGWTYGYRMP
jgi:hypothetical protein